MPKIHISLQFSCHIYPRSEKCENLFKVIIFPYLSAKKKELGYPEDQRSLIIMDTFKGQDNDEMKRLCAKNFETSSWFETSLCSVDCWDIQSSQTPKWFHYRRFRCFRNQGAWYLHTSRKHVRWTETTIEFLVVFSLFSWKHNLIWSFESIDFLIFRQASHCPFFDYWYDFKGSNDVKNKKGTYFRKLNFVAIFRLWKIFIG